jgi:4-hydroxy-2-oxoheptanedioate aldolase
MRANPLRQRIDAGQVAIGAWLTIPSPVSAEVIGTAGFDYVCIDAQHGLVGYSDILTMLIALTDGGATPAVRVAENSPSHIGKALDAGAMAVVVPMINSVEDCRAAVAACRYAPEGSRSYGPTRVGAVQGAGYGDQPETRAMCIPMIETAAAVANLDAILTVEGVEAIYVGPSDLAISLGLEPDTEVDEFHRALDEIVAACDRRGIVPGIHTSLATLDDRVQRGFRIVTILSDIVALRGIVAANLAAVRDVDRWEKEPRDDKRVP